jgi:hypothetical protein
MTDPQNRADVAINAAIAASKILPDRAEHYRAAWDADPTGTEQLLARLEPVPAAALAAPDGPVDLAALGFVGRS